MSAQEISFPVTLNTPSTFLNTFLFSTFLFIMLKGFNKNALACQLIKRSYSSSRQNKSNLSKKLMTGAVVMAGGYCGWEYYKHKTVPQLNTERYSPLKLIKKEQISPDSYRLRVSTKQVDKEFPVPSCLYVKDDTIQVMRPYTPINSNPFKDGFIDLVVKRYENGSVSRTLSGFESNDLVHVRGPMMEEYEYKENTLDEVGMVTNKKKIFFLTALPKRERRFLI